MKQYNLLVVKTLLIIACMQSVLTASVQSRIQSPLQQSPVIPSNPSPRPSVLVRSTLESNTDVDMDTDASNRICCNNKTKNPCAPISITAPTVITTPGHYCLATSLVATGTLITILSSDVLLDLNGHYLQPTTHNAIEIGALPVSHLSNITIQNGFLFSNQRSHSSGIKINASSSGNPHFNILLSDLSINSFAHRGIEAHLIAEFTVQRCKIDANGQNLYADTGSNIALQDSSFSACLTGIGVELNNIAGLSIENCPIAFNDDKNLYISNSNFISISDSTFDGSFTGTGATIINSNAIDLNTNTFNNNALLGMYILYSDQIKIQNCNFSFNNGLAGCHVESSANCLFEQCSFGDSGSQGVLITGLLATAFGFKFLECQAINHTDHGFTFSGSVTDVVLERCAALACFPGTGFMIATAPGSSVTLLECTAKDNLTGFDMSTSLGTGLIRGCNAVNNSLVGTILPPPNSPPTGCGFNDRIGSLYQYLANCAQGNGTGAASVVDTNYCLAGLGSPFIPTTGGPGSTLPYIQYGRNTVTGLFPAGISYWDNVTLQ